MVDVLEMRQCHGPEQERPCTEVGAGTRQAGGNLRGIACALLISVAWVGAAVGGDLDRYRYVLEETKDDNVCRHMEKVYNQHFSYPWRRPMLSTRADDPAYGPNGSYAFPKLPSVSHDNRMTLDMSYSRLPTSPEFEAIDWLEGRYSSESFPDRNHPMLIAEFDINNDGQIDVVVKPSFMLGFEPSHGSAPGGEDALFVFGKGVIDFSRPLSYQMFARGQAGKRKPALISGAHSRRLIRPFVLDGRVYLSIYEQVWEGGEFRDLGTRFTRLESEYMNVSRYRSGSENLAPGKWSPLQLVSRSRSHVNAHAERPCG